MLQAREGVYLHQVIEVTPYLDDEDYIAGWGVPRSEMLDEVDLEDIEDTGRIRIFYY